MKSVFEASLGLPKAESWVLPKTNKIFADYFSRSFGRNLLCVVAVVPRLPS